MAAMQPGDSAKYSYQYGMLPASYPRRPEIRPNPNERMRFQWTRKSCGCQVCPCGFCGYHTTGIYHQLKSTVPPKLAEHGVTESTWKSWVQDWDDNFNPYKKAQWNEFFYVIGCLMLPFFGCFWLGCTAVCCKSICCPCCEGLRYSFNDAARDWLERVREQVPKDVKAYTQIILTVEVKGSGEKQTVTVIHHPILVFTLTPAEAARFEQEPHVVGDKNTLEHLGGCCADTEHEIKKMVI